VLVDCGQLQRRCRPPGEPRCRILGGVAGASGKASGVQAANVLDVPVGVFFPSDFNNDFSVSFTEKQQQGGDLAYNYRREKAFVWRPEQEGGGERAEAQFSATCGTDPATYRRDRPGMSAFVLEDGVVYHTYFHLCARTGRPLGYVCVARPCPQGPQRDGHVVEPPRRIRYALSDGWRYCVTGVRKHLQLVSGG